MFQKVSSISYAFPIIGFNLSVVPNARCDRRGELQKYNKPGLLPFNECILEIEVNTPIIQIRQQTKVKLVPYCCSWSKVDYVIH